MMGDIKAIRERHEYDSSSRYYEGSAELGQAIRDCHADRGILLNEIDRLEDGLRELLPGWDATGMMTPRECADEVRALLGKESEE